MLLDAEPTPERARALAERVVDALVADRVASRSMTMHAVVEGVWDKPVE